MKRNPQRKRNPKDDEEYLILFSYVRRGSLKGSVQRWSKMDKRECPKIGLIHRNQERKWDFNLLERENSRKRDKTLH